MPFDRVSFVICLVLSLVFREVHAPELGGAHTMVRLTTQENKMLTCMPSFRMVQLFSFRLVLQFYYIILIVCLVRCRSWKRGCSS